MSKEEIPVTGENERKHDMYMYAKNLRMILWVGITVLCLSATAWSQNPMVAIKGQVKTAAEGAENVTPPEKLSATQVDQIVAGLSDEKVRRLLINELKLQARQETTVEAKPEGVAGIIDKIKNLTVLLQPRVEYLRSGGSASPQEVGTIYKLLGKGERGIKSVAGVIVSVAAVLAGALLIEWLFVLYTAAAHHRKRATRMDRQDRGPGITVDAGSDRHHRFHCCGADSFFPISGSHRRPACASGGLPGGRGILPGRLPGIAVFPGP